MQKLFNRILVPADLSGNSIRIIERAVELADQYSCTIHLLHVTGQLPLQAVESIQDEQATSLKRALEYQLQTLAKTALEISSKAPANISCSIETGSWEDSIIRFSLAQNIDLVLVSQQGILSGKHKTQLNTDLIATRANAAVITVPGNRCIKRYSSVMIPITDFLPVKKLMYGVYIAVKNNITIRLLGIENAATKDKVMYYVEKAYTLISNNCNVKVVLDKTEATDVSEAVKKYGYQKHTDLIILEPGSQQKTPGLLSTFLANLVQKYAAPPVLTINAG